MGIHSKLLVHWTGKDIEQDCTVTNKSPLYVERLKDVLKNGLFAKRTSEDSIRKTKIDNLVRICFTEIRLSQAQTHAERYGKLGIGFTRDFIMNKGGRPVIYIPYDPKEDSQLLEDSIRYFYNQSGGDTGPKAECEWQVEMRKQLTWIMAHVKRMSNGKNEDYYEEMEWRLVYDESSKNRYFKKERSVEEYRLEFAGDDLKVLIFPDVDAKTMALNDKSLSEYFSEHMPIMSTLDDCSNF